MRNKGFEFESIHQLLNIQGAFLRSKTEETIATLDRIYSSYTDAEDLPVAFLFMNLGQLSFEIGFSTIDKEINIQNDWDYEFNLNDGKSFGIEEYPDFNSEYPVEDYYSLVREAFLNDMLKEFFLECFWNSKLKGIEVKVLYSNDPDGDEVIDLNDLEEYHGFDFLKET